MSIHWLSSKKGCGTLSLYKTNLTFNTVAGESLKDAYRVRIGVEDDAIIIEPLSKERVLRGDLEDDSLFNLKRSASYSRISSTGLSSAIAGELHLDLENEPIRFCTHYDEARDILVASRKEERQ